MWEYIICPLFVWTDTDMLGDVICHRVVLAVADMGGGGGVNCHLLALANGDKWGYVICHLCWQILTFGEISFVILLVDADM